mgnify:CR=1 FL=1
MLRIKFEYRDQFTNGKWRTQTCVCESLKECIEWYGLGKDCEYRIVSVEKIGD